MNEKRGVIMKTIGFLGVGKMGGCILQGILKGLYHPQQIYFYTPNEEHKEEYSALGCQALQNETELYLKSDIILLAVKPQIYSQIATISDSLDFSNRCVISIMAGIEISTLERHFSNASILRAMPNTPCLIGKGVVTLSSKQKDAYFEEAKKIFSAISKVYEIEESQMDESLALNGSMPAFFYYFVQAYIEKSKEFGIDERLAKELCCNTIIGSSQMVLNSSNRIEELIQQVCSKGGITLAGLDALEKNGFVESIDSCYEACVQRAKELKN